MKFYNLKSALQTPSRVTELYLTGQQFRGLPTSVFDFENLEKLELTNTFIRDIPDTIAQLQKLQVFNISGSQVRKLPSTIAQLPALKKVRIAKSPMTDFPAALVDTPLELLVLNDLNIKEVSEELCAMQSLHQLTISRCLIKKMPANIGKLEQLKYLQVSDNQLTRLPKSLAKCTALTEVNISQNELTVLPEWIGAWTLVERLNIANNKIKNLPDSLAQCQSLRYLDSSNNKLKTLPHTFGQLKMLRQFDCSKNPITRLPDALHTLQGLRTWQMNDTKLTALPSNIAQLKSLATFSILKNNLPEIPNWIGELTNLEIFKYDSTIELTQLPESMASWQYIKRLNFGRHRYDFVPTSMLGLTSLIELGGFSQKLKVLPFIQLTKKIALPSTQAKRAFELLQTNDTSEITKSMTLQSLCDLFLLKSTKINTAIHLELQARKGKSIPNTPLKAIKSLHILGKTDFHIPTLKARLAKHQIQWHAKLQADTTHLLLGTNPKQIPQLDNPPSFTQQYELNQHLNSLENLYLIAPASAPKRQRINQMLCSKADTNFTLALQLLQGGGLHSDNYTALYIASKIAENASLKRKLLNFLKLHLADANELVLLQKARKLGWRGVELARYWDIDLLEESL